MGTQVNSLLHLLAFAAYAGVTAAVLLICLPLARAEEDPRRRHRLAAGAMRIYDPLAIAALGVLVMTGAFNLTGYKAALRELFFSRVGGVLAWKLLFAFLLINLSAYMAFGIGHRLVRHLDADPPVDPAWLDGMLARLRASAALALVLTVLTVWFALRLTHAAALGAGGP